MCGSPLAREPLEGQVPVLLVLIISVFVLLLVLFLLATLVSMFSHRSGVAVVLLVVLWVILVPAIPRIAPMIARIAYPTKPYNNVEMEKRLVKSSADVRFHAVVDSIYSGIMRHYGVEVDSLGIFAPGVLTGSAGTAHEEYEKAIEGLEATHRAGIEAQWTALDSARLAVDRSQKRLASFVTRLSPVGTFTILATTLAGTGPDEWGRSLDFARHFQAQVADELYSKWIVRRYGAHRTLTMPADGKCPPLVNRSKLHATFGAAPPSERLRSAGADMLILAGMALLFGAACWFKFRAYDVR
jgi:ABC-type transport system involved in multi-copper enzyme maturation permease subunit